MKHELNDESLERLANKIANSISAGDLNARRLIVSNRTISALCGKLSYEIKERINYLVDQNRSIQKNG